MRCKAEEDYIRKQAAKGIVMNHAEELMVPINNRLDGDEDDLGFQDVSGIDSAMEALATGGGGEEKVDQHPERRRKVLCLPCLHLYLKLSMYLCL